MATSKKNSYITEELEWLEARANDIKTYVNNNPYDKVEDRIKSLNTNMGAADKVMANIETQQKALRESLKDYSLLIEAIDKLRTIEAAKSVEVRGKGKLSPIQEEWLKSKV